MNSAEVDATKYDSITPNSPESSSMVSDQHTEPKPEVTDITWFDNYWEIEGSQAVNAAVSIFCKKHVPVVLDSGELIGKVYEKVSRKVREAILTPVSGNLTGYIYRTTWNSLLDLSRSQQREADRLNPLSELDYMRFDDSMAVLPETLLFEEIYFLLMNSFTEAEQIVFQTYYHGFSAKESAAFFGISEGALKSRRHRLWLRAQAIIAENGYSADMFDILYKGRTL